jgi:hypothetical protein
VLMVSLRRSSALHYTARCELRPGGGKNSGLIGFAGRIP